MNKLIISLVLSAVSSTAFAADQFILGWPSNISPTVAPIVMGVTQGYYKEENIELVLQPLAGSSALIPQLMNKGLSAGYMSYESVVLSKVEGDHNFPIKFVYNLDRRNEYTITVAEESPYQTFKDLRGKRLGVISLGAGNLHSTAAMFQLNGVDWNDIEKIPVGTGTAPQLALTSGQVDALNMWNGQDKLTRDNGVALRTLEIPEAIRNAPGAGIAVLTEVFDTNPDLYARFGRALSKSILACKAEPEICLASLLQQYPQFRPEDGNLEKPLERLLGALNVLIHFREGEPRLMGRYPDGAWDNAIAATNAGGNLQIDVPATDLYSDALVSQYNDFSVDELVKNIKPVAAR